MNISDNLKNYVIENFLDQESSDQITSESPLLELGILDSFSMLKLVDWIESKYSIKLGPDEVTAENFGSLESITATIERHV